MMKDVADLLARIFISLIFFYEAFDSIIFFKNTKETMTAYGVTWQQDLLLSGVIFLLIVGSLLVLIGYYSRVGSWMILLYWIPFTMIVYSFWNDPLEIRRLHSLYFMRNMGVAAALLLIIVNGSGKYSIRRMLHVLRLPKN
jgi:uncharacterized membrane protein YphA (DoxX/SURF4 family)